MTGPEAGIFPAPGMFVRAEDKPRLNKFENRLIPPPSLKAGNMKRTVQHAVHALLACLLLAAPSARARVAIQWQASHGINDPAAPGAGANLPPGSLVQLFWSADMKVGGDILLAGSFTTQEGCFAFGPMQFGNDSEYEGGYAYIKVFNARSPRAGSLFLTSSFADMSRAPLPNSMTPTVIDIAGLQIMSLTNQTWNRAAIGDQMDVDGDGKADLALYDQASGLWYVCGADGQVLLWARNWGGPGLIPVRGDFDGDGAGDLALYYEATGAWFIQGMAGNLIAWGAQWGGPEMIPVSGDYDGDGISDLAAYHEESGFWFILTMQGEVLAWAKPWGGPGFAPVSGDYNGDWISDLPVYHQASGNWFVTAMDDTLLAWADAWGGTGYEPVGGDYNGDRESDLAVYATEHGDWYIRTMQGEILAWARPWGAAGLLPVCGDYDGDGVHDLAVYDQANGLWYICDMNGNLIQWQLGWGGENLLPVR